MSDLTGIGSILDFGGKILDRIMPDEETREAAKFQLFKAQQDGRFKEIEADIEMAKAQSAINVEEAKSTNLFVSGARPFIMWVCGVALLYASIIDPILRFVASVIYGYSGSFPAIDTSITLQLLFGLLGLGAYRTFEKVKGVAS